MEWINFHVSVLDSPEFLTSEPIDRATWLCLYRYCAGQENGGVIADCAEWADRTWMRMCGVSLKEVRRVSPLWLMENNALRVLFYNLKAEAGVSRLRSTAAAGGHARWHKNKEPVGVPSPMPVGMPQGTGEGNAKRKEREGKEMKYNSPSLALGTDGQETPSPRTRKPKAGAILPSEQPEDLRERMTAVGALKGRQVTTSWTAKEFEAFQAARLHDCSAADFAAQLEAMRPYYAKNIPREIDFRRRELLTLLNNWPGELDKARVHNRDNNDGITMK